MNESLTGTLNLADVGAVNAADSVIPLTSWTPPVHHRDLPGCGGRIGEELEDFRVQEIPLYALFGTGEHVWVCLEKRGITTPALQQIVARAAGVKERDVGAAGLKDKHAVTSQWLSFLATRSRLPAEWELPPEVKLLETTRHNNKLRTGHLAGNRFVLRLVDVTNPENAAAIAQRISESGVPNYYGAQRFGKDQNNLEQAVAWLRNPRSRGSRFIEKLFPSVIQSEVFNRVMGKRETLAWNRVLVGDVVRLSGSTRHFIVEDAEKEQTRLDSGDILLTGPMVGPKMLQPKAEAADFEREALDQLGLGEAEIARLGEYAPGTRRDARLRPTDVSCQIIEPNVVELSFGLDAGGYATQVVREFTRAVFGHDGRKRDTEGKSA